MRPYEANGGNDGAAGDLRSASFALERFDWAAPDRLEVVGTFTAWDAPAGAVPSLAVRGVERMHHLSALADRLSGPPGNGRWSAEFAWQGPPEAFEHAELRFGADVVIELPEPRRRSFHGQLLKLRPPFVEPQSPAHAAAGDPSTVDAPDMLRLQTELLTAQEDVRELRASVERADTELARMYADLAAERERRQTDVARFRAGLEMISSSADAGRAQDRSLVEQLSAQLRDAQQALASREASAHEEMERLRGELADARRDAEAAKSRLQRVQTATAEALTRGERVGGMLTTVLDQLND